MKYSTEIKYALVIQSGNFNSKILLQSIFALIEIKSKTINTRFKGVDKSCVVSDIVY